MPPQAGGTRHLLTALSQLGPQTHAHVSPVILTAPLSQARTLRLRERASPAAGHTTCNWQSCVSNPAVYPPCVRMRGEGAGRTSAWARCLECTPSALQPQHGVAHITYVQHRCMHTCVSTHMGTQSSHRHVLNPSAPTHVCTHTVSQHGGEEGTQLPIRERVSTLCPAGARALLQARWPRLPGLAKASPCHLCPLGMISSLMVVSKDSKQTRRTQAGLSGLLPQYPHRTRTHTCTRAHAHTTQNPALAGKRGRNLLWQHLAAALYTLLNLRAAQAGGRKSR